MQKTEMMQELWRKAEASSNDREKKLLEIAGNLIEATFSTTSLPLAIDTALQDSLGGDHLREDLADCEEVNHLEWLEKRRDMAMELAELGMKSALILHARLDKEVEHIVDRIVGGVSSR